MTDQPPGGGYPPPPEGNFPPGGDYPPPGGNYPPPGGNYPPPGGNYPPPGGGYPPYGGGGYGGYGGPPAQPQSSTPQVLAIIGIVCWFCCSPAAIVLGLIAQNQFRNQGRPDTLARVAWIGGIVALAIGIVFAIANHGNINFNTNNG